ncbi:hypothetical protein NK739_004366 [Escherichia coli]|nr:hypothetical protein [Escherichia coli]EIG1362036.1 hypothetical protein [Escherichia coli]EIG2045294.1 hypothetical protein [Escherichia coli]EJK2761280.1 hypothetical protein [Escherichia coli]
MFCKLAQSSIKAMF